MSETSPRTAAAKLRTWALAQRRSHPDKIGMSKALRGPWPCVCHDCAVANAALDVLDELAALRSSPPVEPANERA